MDQYESDKQELCGILDNVQTSIKFITENVGGLSFPSFPSSSLFLLFTTHHDLTQKEDVWQSTRLNIIWRMRASC